MPKYFLAITLALCILSTVTHAEQIEPMISDSYAGGFKDDFPELHNRVRTLMSAARQEIFARLGLLQANQVFSNPVTVTFTDGASAVSENPFFYVQIAPPGQPFGQNLVANVEAYAHHRHRTPSSEDEQHAVHNAFYYAMTELILNDLAAGQPDKILPPWAQEGLAVYLSGSGPDWVKGAAEHTPRSRAHELSLELNRSFPFLNKQHYAQYYLAIQYLYDTGGVNALQQFVREIVAGQSAAEAVHDTLGQYWPDFERNVHAYSESAFQAVAPPDDDPQFTNPNAVTWPSTR